MKKIISFFIALLIFGFISTESKAQTIIATCSGTYTFGAGSCSAITIGNGTPGSIQICLTTNNIAGGGGSSCNPGGSCNPPYNGGGWPPRIAIFASNGTTYQGGSQANWFSTTPTPTCFTLTTTNGYATIFGLCALAGSTITWTTVNTCGDQVCTGTPPPCAGPPCSSCNTACGTAVGYSTSPTVSQVVADCQTTPFSPVLPAGSTHTFCHDFQATNATVNFSVVVTSNCGGGNVTNFSWALYNATCGGAIQTGTLSSLTFSGLTVGNNYVFCYTFTVPSTCTHSQHCPYFVGATVLPITLSHFDAKYNPETIAVELDWATISEINNEFFTVEKSVDGVTFEVVSIVKGAGNSSAFQDYNSLDKNPYYGTSYYRLKQTDFDGSFEYSNMVPVKVEKEISDVTIYPNPVSGNGTLSLNVLEKGITTVVIYDISGRQVYSQQHNTNKGANTISLETNLFSNGMYFISITNGTANENLKFIKE